MTDRDYRTEPLKVTDRDPMDDFVREDVTLLGETRRVYRTGNGPAVIVMAEMPGIYAHVIRFARMVRDAGFSVWMPALFGTEGGPVTMAGGAATMIRACISREFRAFAADRSSPITAWLRALAAHALPLCGGRGVGAIGMCFTGNFALSMMLEPAMLAPVLSQPSLPMLKADGMHIAPDELEAVKARMEKEDLTVLAYRFEGDRFCRAERFAAYQEALGDRFIARVLADDSALPGTPMRPHSVVTLHLIDEAGEPTRAAVDEILAFFHKRLDDPGQARS
ncbi:MAG: dienelactone hydrolase family protein [Pseudomonadales bacterium]|jgi:dienelactone hydrolase